MSKSRNFIYSSLFWLLYSNKNTKQTDLKIDSFLNKIKDIIMVFWIYNLKRPKDIIFDKLIIQPFKYIYII